jgi:hypothetical protein
MNSLIKTYIKSVLDFYRQTKNTDTTFNTNLKAMIDYVQPMQCKLFKITDFDSVNSTDWTFDYEDESMTNSSGTSKDLVSKSFVLNNFKLKKTILEGTGLTTAIISYTTSTTLLNAVWIPVATGNDDLDLSFETVPTTGIRFKISNGDSVVEKMYFLFELI